MVPWPWKPDPDYHRLLNVLHRQGIPPRVVFLELFADPEIIAAILEEPAYPYSDTNVDHEFLERWVDQNIRFWYNLGYDAFWLGPDLSWGNLQPLESFDTAPLSRGKRAWVNEKAGLITSWNDFENFPWPKISQVDFFPLEYASLHLPEGMGIIAQVNGILETAMWLMGYESFALAIYDQPDLVEALFIRLAEVYLPLARTIVEMDNIIAVWMGDDMGFRTSTMISPKHLRKWVFPLQKQIVSLAHAKGLPFLLHSCGKLEAIMPELIDYVGIDAKHSFEDLIEPVEKFSTHYGNRISVIGGVDMDILARGTEEQVRLRTRQILEACIPTGGYILGSGNSIANYIPPRNFLAMLDEGKKY